MAPALKGIKVLDLCHLGPGMFCTMILADFGAEVLKIDRPGQPRGPQTAEQSVWSFERAMEVGDRAFNRNKKSIVLNFKSEEAREIFYKLAESADVVVEGFRPGVTKRLGIDYETVKAINPRIVYCSLSGYGQSGPYAEFPGHDVNYISVGGALNMIGERDKSPIIPLNLLADLAGASLQGAISILIALMARHQTGQGQYIDFSYTDAVVYLVSMFAFGHLNYGADFTRGTTPFGGAFPGYGVYQTKEGKYISVGCFEPYFWENLCRFVGREDFLLYQFAEGEKREEIFAYMRQFFLTKSRDEWFDLMKDKNIPIGKVYDLDEVFSDPQLQHRQLLHEINLPDGRKEQAIGFGMKLLGTPGEIRWPAPVPGEHTKETLLGIGYSEEMITELDRQGSIVLADA